MDEHYQLEMQQLDKDGAAVQVYPVNTAEDVIVGTLEAGTLTLPGSSDTETADVTLANIKKYLSNLSNLASAERKVSTATNSTSDTDVASASAVASVKNDVDGKAPTSHAATTTTYGGATSANYGHVKLVDTYEVGDGEEAAGADDSVAVSQKALAALFTALNEAKAPNDHSSEDTTYGIATQTKFGHVKISDEYQAALEHGKAEDGVAVSQYALHAVYDEILNTTSGNTETAVSGRAPTNHASETTTYGAASATQYGHVKLADNYTVGDDESAGSAADAVGASQKAVADAYAALDSAKADKSHASSDTTYGAGTSSNYGHVKLSDTYDSTNGSGADSSVAASQKAVTDAYSALNTAKADKSHASADTTYGAGSDTNYGHVKVSDTYTSQVGAAADGLTASQKALYDAYTSLSTADSTHADTKATASTFAHVKLTDEYSVAEGSTAGAAADGVGASQKALADAYAALAKSISDLTDTVSTLSGTVETNTSNISTNATNISNLTDTVNTNAPTIETEDNEVTLRTCLFEFTDDEDTTDTQSDDEGDVG